MTEPTTPSSATPQAMPAPSGGQGEPIVNRLSIQVATVNGSGSQTANNTLLRALFQMGIPVSGKNLFPSNIAGLPTWFTIRANADGYTARRREVDVCVCMNAATAQQDVTSLPAGATVVYEETLKCEKHRDDLDFYPVPFNKMIREICPSVSLRRLVVNMIYVGVLAELLGIDTHEIESALQKAFAKKPKALDVNVDAVRAGVAWTREHVDRRPRFRVERMDATAGKILVDGNTAAAIGALFAGVTVADVVPHHALVQLDGGLDCAGQQVPEGPRVGQAEPRGRAGRG